MSLKFGFKDVERFYGDDAAFPLAAEDGHASGYAAMRQDNKQIAHDLLSTAVGGATAFGVGMIEGSQNKGDGGEVMVGKVPVTIIGAGVASLAGVFLGNALGGYAAPVLHGVGRGMLDVYTHNAGMRIGSKMAKEKAKKTTPAAAGVGALPAGRRMPTPEDMQYGGQQQFAGFYQP